jgi:hypothetical protein
MNSSVYKNFTRGFTRYFSRRGAKDAKGAKEEKRERGKEGKREEE